MIPQPWVALAAITPQARALYWLIAVHVPNGHDSVEVTLEDLAAMLGFSRGDKIQRYRDELVQLGAISYRRMLMPARCIYTVRREPPASYTGPRTVAGWQRARGVAA